MIHAIFQYQFMRNAVLAALFASIVCGIMGVIIIEKKMVMMAGGIAHTSYGGVGLGYLLGFEPILGALGFAVVASIGIGAMRHRGMTRTDILISLFWSLGMASGILFIALMNGYPPDLSSYLFGSILSVTKTDLWLIAILALLVALAFITLFADWKVYLFDDEFSGIVGVNIRFLDNLLMVLIALSVVVLIRVVGIILVLALLTAPAATAELFTRRFKPRVLLSMLISALYSLTGLWLSYQINIASGASIVIVSVFCYLLLFSIRRRSRRREHSQSRGTTVAPS